MEKQESRKKLKEKTPEIIVAGSRTETTNDSQYVKPTEERKPKRKRRTKSEAAAKDADVKEEPKTETKIRKTTARRRRWVDQTPDEELPIKYQHIKKSRDKYREAKKDPTGSKLMQQRLGIVYYVAKTKRYTWKRISERTRELSKKDGEIRYYPEQTIAWWRSIDDCQLSNVYGLLKAMDVKATADFTYPQGPEVIIKNSTFIAKGKLKSETNTKIKQKWYKMALEDPTKRLHFLAKFIEWTGMPFYIFARKVGTGSSRLELWFERDDIKISRLYRIAETFNTTIEWRISDIRDE